MNTTLNIAGDVAGTKNRRSAFSMPMHAAATAMSSRNGMLTRVSYDRQRELAPGVSVKPVANAARERLGEDDAEQRRATPVTRSSPLMTCEPSRHAAALPSRRRGTA